jgi:hypothetical protein
MRHLWRLRSGFGIRRAYGRAGVWVQGSEFRVRSSAELGLLACINLNSDFKFWESFSSSSSTGLLANREAESHATVLCS